MAWRAPIILGGLFISALTLSVASASTPGDGAYAPEPLDDSTIVDSLPEVAPPEVADPPNAAELEDLQHVATQQGITLEVAIERYAWRDNLALAVAQIRELAPDDFAGAEIVDANSAWIAFSDTASPEALNKLQVFLDSHPEISVEVRTGWGCTELELQTAIEIVHYTLLEQPDVIDVASTHEYTANQIVSTIVDDSDSGIPLDEYRNAAISALVDAGLGHLLDHIDISVRGSPVPFLGSDDSSSKHLGGESLSTCTSGFAVRSFGGALVNGIATAGHCNDNQSDDGTALTFVYDYENTHGNFQWHTGPQPKPDNFYPGNATTTEVNERDVSSVGAPIVGQNLCRNGKVSHLDCQDVRKLNVCKGSRCNLVQMGADLSTGGDSGGSVFSGNTAYGFHQGEMFDPWPFDRDVFSRADRIDNAMSVNVRTS